MTSKLATTKVAALFVTASVILSAFAFAVSAKADTVSDLQAQIAALTAQIAALSGGKTMTTTSSSACFTFTRNQKLGDNGGEVMQIQKFLNSSPDTQIATMGAGSPGNETSHFGPATKAAVIKFQEKYAADILTPVGLTKGTGTWGAGSRAKANSLCTTSTGTTGGTPGTTTTTPTGTGITVAAATQPTNSLAPAGASRVPFTTFTLTNNSGAAVTINGVTVQRTGLAQDAAFSGVVLIDQNGMQMGVSRTFDSNHQATLGDTFALQAGQSVTYTVAGNMSTVNAASYSGQVGAISVIGVNTSVPVAGSLPITGAQQTFNSTLTMGSVTTNISTFDPQGAQTKHIGDTAVRFTGARFTAGSAEDVKFYSIRFRINGSVGATDLSNVVTVVNGTSYPATISADGRYFTSTFPGGILITKGNAVDAYLQADITGSNASGRTAEFDIDRTYDAYFVGQTYGYGIQPALGSGSVQSGTHGTTITNSQPWFQGSTVTIQGGTATTIQNSTSVTAQNIATNVSNQALGGFDANFSGEPVTVQGLTVNLSTTGLNGVSDLIRTVSIVDQNGSVIAGPVDATGATSTQTLTFSNSVTFPTGLHTYILKGTLPSDYPNGATVQASTNPSGSVGAGQPAAWTGVQGQITGNSLTLGVSTFTMNTMTVRGASLVVSASPSPVAQNVVAGGQQMLFTTVQLDASQSGEDVRLANIPVTITMTSNDAQYLSTCQVYNGTTALNTGSNVVNTFSVSGSGPYTATPTFTFDTPFTVTKGTVANLGVECNLSSSAPQGASHTFQFGVSGSISAIGATSGNNISASVTAGNSGVMTVAGAGSLAVNVDSSSPSYSVSSGGTTGVVAGVFHLRATNEGVNLTKLGLTIANSSAATTSPALSNNGASDLTKVYLYNSSNQLIGTAYFTGNSTVATSTLTTPLNLPVGQDVLVTAKVDLAAIGYNQIGDEGALVKVDPLNYEGTGASSGTTVRGAATAGVAGIRMFHTFPTVALSSTLPTNGVSDGRLIRFAVTADSHNPLGIGQFMFTIASSSITSISNVNLYAYTDAGYSTPISGVGTGGQVNAAAITPVVGASNSTVTVIPNASTNSYIQVPAGQTYYFQLSGTVAANGTTYNVATTLLGDSSFYGMSSLAAATSTTNGGGSAHFVWSPNATTTSSIVTSDWTNGAGLVGLPSSGVVQNRTN